MIPPFTVHLHLNNCPVCPPPPEGRVQPINPDCVHCLAFYAGYLAVTRFYSQAFRRPTEIEWR